MSSWFWSTAIFPMPLLAMHIWAISFRVTKQAYQVSVTLKFTDTKVYVFRGSYMVGNCCQRCNICALCPHRPPNSEVVSSMTSLQPLIEYLVGASDSALIIFQDKRSEKSRWKSTAFMNKDTKCDQQYSINFQSGYTFAVHFDEIGNAAVTGPHQTRTTTLILQTE